MRVLIDTNIYLDVALQRQAFAEDSSAVIKRVGKAGTLLFAPHSLATTYYLCERALGRERAINRVSTLLKMAQIGDFGHEEAQASLNLGVRDFEDSMILATALANKVDWVITRNLEDFPSAVSSKEGHSLQVTAPELFLETVKEKY